MVEDWATDTKNLGSYLAENFFISTEIYKIGISYFQDLNLVDLLKFGSKPVRSESEKKNYIPIKNRLELAHAFAYSLRI